MMNNKERAATLRWGSHLPVLGAVGDVIKPLSCVELGIGRFSTPAIVGFVKQYVGVENDVEWIEHVRPLCPPGTQFLYHPINGTKRSTLKRHLGVGAVRRIVKDYREYRRQFSSLQKPSLLFVDQFACARYISIAVLTPVFDCVVYHDAEPDRRDLYEYSQLPVFSGYRHYKLTWSRVMLGDKQVALPWTGLLIKTGLFHSDLTKAIEAYAAGYLREFGAVSDARPVVIEVE